MAEQYIEIPIDDDIQLGFDETGFPRTEPTAKPAPVKEAKEPAEKAAKAEPAIDPDEFAATKRRADDAAAREQAARSELEAERQARIKAEKDRGETVDKAADIYWEGVKAGWQKINTDRDLIANSKTFMASELERAKERHRAAGEAADSAAQTEAAADMADISAKLRDLARGLESADEHIAREKARIEREWDQYSSQREKSAREAAEPEPPKKKEESKKQQTPEDWIAQFPRKLAGWLTDNKDYVTDPKKNRDFIEFANEYAADYGQGAVQTPQFVQALREKFEPKAPAQETTREDEMAESDVETEEAAPPPSAKKSAPAAPVSRSSPGRPASGNTIRLTTEQHALAPDLYPNYDDLSPEAKKKFPAWSPTAARYQYHADLKRAEAEGRFQR